jgi:hypothetical protein
MADGTVFLEGWTLDDVQWSRFDPSKVDRNIVAAIKAAALVEYAAPDYVVYLKRVFAGSDPEVIDSIERWGREEIQHGQALSRWAALADPSFDFADTFARFQAGYRPEHFDGDDQTSVRGSRRGEMIARCVVESGTSSYYSAIRDATDEPVLKEITGRIAADEFRHYKLFFETLNAQAEPDLPFWKKAMVAIGRINESDDDELAFAYYCATVSKDREAQQPYVRADYAKASYGTSLRLYRRQHIQKLTQMVSKAIGVDPQGRITRLAGALLWRMLRMRAGLSGATAEVAA